MTITCGLCGKPLIRKVVTWDGDTIAICECGKTSRTIERGKAK